MVNKLIYSIRFLLDRYFPVILVLVVFVSYGQTLGMGVWEDDNALFFKLAHIQEAAGFLGDGPLGQGPYKYTATLYFPVYYLFGYNTFFYFAYALIFYILATFVIYKTFSYILGKSGGKIAGFLFACGFIASEGLIRLFNSVITSLSIMLISGLLYFYWKFLKEKKNIWYFFALVIFTASMELASARTHYLVSVVILFELIFFAFQKPIRSIGYSLIRLIPFLLLFYKFFVISGDSRNLLIKDYINHILNGNFYVLYGLIGTFTNIIIPGWMLTFLNNIQSKIILTTGVGFPFAKYFLLTFSLILLWFFFRKHNFKLFLMPFYISILVGWVFLSKKLFVNPILNLDETQLLTVTLGGILLVLFSIIPLFLTKEKRKISIFLFCWVIVNILAYSIYNSGYAYPAENRYLAHSLFALVGIMGLFFVSVKGNTPASKVTLVLILLWGFGNLISSVFYQHNILITRSFPAKLMYQELMSFVSKVGKGDVFYFDVADEAKSQFKDAVSVAQMPETTSLAWRYGVDRYDISKFEDFEQFATYLTKETDLSHIHSFFYSKGGLVDTSEMMRMFLTKGTSLNEIKPIKTHIAGQVANELVFNFPEPLVSIYPMNLFFIIRAQLPDMKLLKYPFYADPLNNNPDESLKDIMFAYQKNKELLLKDASFSVSSQWQNNTVSNLQDKDISTVWQPDRILWKARDESITVDLKNPQEIDRLVWVNGFSDQTPVKYKIEVSDDRLSWLSIKEVSEVKRKERSLQIENLPVVKTRFIRMTITDTLKGDAPAIAEIWPVPHIFSGLDIIEAEEFLSQPFNYVLNQEDFERTLSQLNFRGNVSVYWKTDKSNNWQTNFNAKIHPIYDGVTREYKLEVPASGIKLSSLKLSNVSIPGNLELQRLFISRSNLLTK